MTKISNHTRLLLSQPAGGATEGGAALNEKRTDRTITEIINALS